MGGLLREVLLYTDDRNQSLKSDFIDYLICTKIKKNFSEKRYKKQYECIKAANIFRKHFHIQKIVIHFQKV